MITPFGGGAGMVMRPDIVSAAVDAAKPAGDQRPLIYLTPRGRRLDQGLVQELSLGPGAILLCGRYEGVDQRVIDARQCAEVSIGDFVLSGGETCRDDLVGRGHSSHSGRGQFARICTE